MSKFVEVFKILGVSVALIMGTIILAAPAQSQSLEDVLNAIERDSNEMTTEDQQRLRRFQQELSTQKREMTRLKNNLVAVENKIVRLKNEFELNELTIEEVEARIKAEAGDFGELLGQFRTAAGETMPEIANSIANFDYPGRVEGLSTVAQAKSLPDRPDLDRLPKSILQEMVAQSEVKTFSANVANAGADGENVDIELIRIGVFTAATTKQARFVEVISSDDTSNSYLKAFGAQPAQSFRSAISDLVKSSDNTLVRAPVDPSKGTLFGILGDLPSIGDRLNDGGTVGLIIMILLSVGVAISVFKIVTLSFTSIAMGQTAKTRLAGDNNPLARVFEVYETNKSRDSETLELKLDERILAESPKIERLNDVVKVLAAVAPLLGLLGTVIGMIITFTAITIYGAGDPQLMADGISVALMTTVLGLIAAIPLLLLHAVISSMSRSCQQLLDEQAAGLIAEKAEG